MRRSQNPWTTNRTVESRRKTPARAAPFRVATGGWMCSTDLATWKDCWTAGPATPSSQAGRAWWLVKCKPEQQPAFFILFFLLFLFVVYFSLVSLSRLTVRRRKEETMRLPFRVRSNPKHSFEKLLPLRLVHCSLTCKQNIICHKLMARFV